jgi:hypothetical protein
MNQSREPRVATHINLCTQHTNLLGQHLKEATAHVCGKKAGEIRSNLKAAYVAFLLEFYDEAQVLAESPTFSTQKASCFLIGTVCS